MKNSPQWELIFYSHCGLFMYSIKKRTGSADEKNVKIRGKTKLI